MNSSNANTYIGPSLKSIGDGQNYVRGRHIGVRIKAALIGCIYSKALQVNLSASKESMGKFSLTSQVYSHLSKPARTIGKLNNLISVDVSEIQSFWCYSHFMWSTPYEIIIATSLLFTVLGKAALAGIITMAVRSASLLSSFLLIALMLVCVFLCVCMW